MKTVKHIVSFLFTKTGVAAQILLVLISIAVVYYFNRHTSPKDDAGSVVTTPDLLSPAKPVYDKYIQLFSYIVKPGDTFAGILAKFNIPEKQSSAWYASLKAIGLPSLFPGDSLVLTKDRNENLTTCSLLSRFDHWYHIYNNDSTVRTEKKPLETTRYRCAMKGVLNTSLSEDMYKMGISDALVMKFADIFAWDINFFMDPQKGDTFEVLFEKNYRQNQFTGYGPILAAKYTSGRKTFHAIALKDERGAIEYYDLNGKSVQKQFLKAPLRYNHISSSFSYSRKHPVLGIYRPHLGIDYAAPQGTPVYAAADGTIRFSGVSGQYGKQVIIGHGASYETFYGHLSAISRGITGGARVKQGQMIGTVGSTGLATGPHLDYRMKVGGRFVNSMKISLPSKEGVPALAMERFIKTKYGFISAMESALCGREGCFIIDVMQPEKQKRAISFISEETVTDHGNPSHS